MKSLKDFNYLLSLDRRYTKTESEIFRYRVAGRFVGKALRKDVVHKPILISFANFHLLT